MAELDPKKTYGTGSNAFTSKSLNYKQMPNPVSGGDSGTSTSFATPKQPYNGADSTVPYSGDVKQGQWNK